MVPGRTFSFFYVYLTTNSVMITKWKILGYRDPRYKHENPSEQVKVRWIKWSYVKLHEFHKVTKSHEKL